MDFAHQGLEQSPIVQGIEDSSKRDVDGGRGLIEGATRLIIKRYHREASPSCWLGAVGVHNTCGSALFIGESVSKYAARVKQTDDRTSPVSYESCRVTDICRPRTPNKRQDGGSSAKSGVRWRSRAGQPIPYLVNYQEYRHKIGNGQSSGLPSSWALRLMRMAGFEPTKSLLDSLGPKPSAYTVPPHPRVWTVKRRGACADLSPAALVLSPQFRLYRLFPNARYRPFFAPRNNSEVIDRLARAKSRRSLMSNTFSVTWSQCITASVPLIKNVADSIRVLFANSGIRTGMAGFLLPCMKGRLRLTPGTRPSSGTASPPNRSVGGLGPSSSVAKASIVPRRLATTGRSRVTIASASDSRCSYRASWARSQSKCPAAVSVLMLAAPPKHNKYKISLGGWQLIF